MEVASSLDASRLLFHNNFHYDEYKDGSTTNTTYQAYSGNTKKASHSLLIPGGRSTPAPASHANSGLQRDISLSTIHSNLPTYTSHHLNKCLDECSDRDLIKYIKWKADSQTQTLRSWMRIIASSLIPATDHESALIHEWYYHLLHMNPPGALHHHTPNFQSSTTNTNNSDNKQQDEDTVDSASDEDEHYSISTELDMSVSLPTKPTANIASSSSVSSSIATQKPQTSSTKKAHKRKPLSLDLNATFDPSFLRFKQHTKPTLSTPSNPSPLPNKKAQLSNLLDLPFPWLLHLFSHYFSFSTLLQQLPLVCQQFRTLSGDPNVWKSIKFPIHVIRNISQETPRNAVLSLNPSAPSSSVNPAANVAPSDSKQNVETQRTSLSIHSDFATRYNTAYFVSFLMRSCRQLQVITFEGSIEENDWNAWNHCMKLLGNHALRQIKWNAKASKVAYPVKTIAQYFASHQHPSLVRQQSAQCTVIDTLFVRCRHISRRGYCWLQSLAYIPTIEHIHCAALSRSDDVQHMVYNFDHLKTLNVNILGPRHPNRNFHTHHRLALKSISHLIPSSVTEFAIPVSVQEDFVRECFSRMPLLENLDFFRLTTPHQNVDIDSWACCLSSETIYHLAKHCKRLRKCQLFVKCFKPKTEIWDSVKFLLKECKGIHMLTIGMTESETLNGLHKMLPEESENVGADGEVEYDKLSKRYFDQLKKVPFLRKRFRKFKKKTMKFPKFTIMWCLLT